MYNTHIPCSLVKRVISWYSGPIKAPWPWIAHCNEYLWLNKNSWHSAGSGDRSNANALKQIFSTHRAGWCYNVTMLQYSKSGSHMRQWVSASLPCACVPQISAERGQSDQRCLQPKSSNQKRFPFIWMKSRKYSIFCLTPKLSEFPLSDADLGPAPPCGGLLEQSPRAVQVNWALCLHGWVRCQLGF